MFHIYMIYIQNCEVSYKQIEIALVFPSIVDQCEINATNDNLHYYHVAIFVLII